MPRPKIDPEVKKANHKACYQRWRNRLKEAGKCVKCQAPSSDGKTTCTECRRVERIKYQARYRRYAAANLKQAAKENKAA